MYLSGIPQLNSDLATKVSRRATLVVASQLRAHEDGGGAVRFLPTAVALTIGWPFAAGLAHWVSLLSAFNVIGLA